jgi:hypothetical protein
MEFLSTALEEHWNFRLLFTYLRLEPYGIRSVRISFDPRRNS